MLQRQRNNAQMVNRKKNAANFGNRSMMYISDALCAKFFMLKGKQMIEEKLLTKRDLGAFFRLSPPYARALCEKHGVLPLNVGTGKIARLRWRLSDVMQVLTILQSGPTEAQKDFRPRRKGDARVAGLSAKEVLKAVANAVQ